MRPAVRRTAWLSQPSRCTRKATATPASSKARDRPPQRAKRHQPHEHRVHPHPAAVLQVGTNPALEAHRCRPVCAPCMATFRFAHPSSPVERTVSQRGALWRCAEPDGPFDPSADPKGCLPECLVSGNQAVRNAALDHMAPDAVDAAAKGPIGVSHPGWGASASALC
jgi:hypothetical protein